MIYNAYVYDLSDHMFSALPFWLKQQASVYSALAPARSAQLYRSEAGYSKEAKGKIKEGTITLVF